MAVVTLLLFFSFSLARAAQSVTLAWNASPSAGVTGYKVYYGTVAGSPSTSINVGNVTTATVSNLNDATTYFFSVTAYNSAGLESQRSTEISYKTPSPAPGTYRLTVNNGSGDGTYTTGTSVIVTADPPAQGQQFAGWEGDTAILGDLGSSPTGALMISRDVTITATYSALVTVTNGIRFYPRDGVATTKMIGGIFEGTNGNPVVGPYTAIYTIAANPPQNWSAVNANLGSYRYLRYRAPNGSYGNVAEIEFYRAGVKVTGTGFGTPGSWNNVGNTFAKALDGDVNTFFDGPTADGNYVGIDTGSGGSASYAVTVANGTGDGSYAAGAPVSITADAPPAGQQFAGWTGSVTFANASSPTTTFTMPSSAVTVTATYITAASSTPITIWSSRTVPGVVDNGSGSAVQLGVKFRSDVAGTIRGIRFYKGAANTGTHVGSLWSSTGTRLATATFTGETGSGWQQVNFTTPVAISANSTYVASYHTTSGRYSIDANYFASAGADNAPLHAPANGGSGGNGVYAYGSSDAFPNQTWNASNYWVDVVFQPN